MDGLFDAKEKKATKWLPNDVDEEFYSQHMNTLAVYLYCAQRKTNGCNGKGNGR